MRTEFLKKSKKKKKGHAQDGKIFFVDFLVNTKRVQTPTLGLHSPQNTPGY